jgi:hypothetical protein
MAYDSAHQQVVLFGGYYFGYLADTWVWDGANWTQKSPSTSPPARAFFAMTYDSMHQQVVLFGGDNGSYLGDTWVWNGTDWSHKFPATSPSARSDVAMAYDSAHGQAVLFGGANDSYLGDTWVWDGANWTQKFPVTSPPARVYHAMTYDSSHGQALLFGGQNSSIYLGDTWVWDGTNWAQESPATAPSSRASPAMAYDAAHQQVILFGGDANAVLADTWIWYRSSFANWAQDSPSSIPSARINHAMAYDSLDGQTVLFGGYNGSISLGDTWVWNGINWTQKSPITSPPPRYDYAMVYDAAHGQVVLFGGVYQYFFVGEVATQILGDTWIWDGANWTQKSPTTSPPARYAHAMAYDAAHGQVVLFGGLNTGSSIIGDTWVWDGTNWTQKSPTTNPTARYSHAMAYDSAHANAVLFGGNNGSALADTWLWNGVNWSQPPGTAPPARYGHAMVYESSQQQVVLFGGAYQFSVGGGVATVFLGDTWIWDGSNWTQKSLNTNPAARSAHVMAYDAAHTQVVLFGGLEASYYLSDTWVWEGGFSVSPNSGSGVGAQVYSATYFDTNGASDLQAVYLDFGSVGDAPNNCKVGYAQAANTLYLFNNANNGVVGSLILGGGGSLSNSQCTLFGGSTAASSLGNNLTVPFQIQFLAGFAGQKTIFGVAESYSGTFSNGGAFQALGTWTPATSTPSVVSVNPINSSGQGPITFNAMYSDTGGASDLDIVYLDFGSVGSASTINPAAEHNCIVLYTPGSNNLYLFTDDNSTSVGPITLGSGGGTLNNSQCTVSSGSTAATFSGTNLTVPFNIAFKSGYGGKKQIFGLAITYGGTASNGGLWLPLGSWEPATSTPSAASLNPNSGTGVSPQVFTAGYSDTGGANDLQVVYLSFSATTFLATNSCNVGYEPGNNSLFLLSDTNATIATVGEGLGGSVSNSQCTLSGGNNAAFESGNGLTVPFNITFKSGFTSPKTIFGLAQTYDGTQSAITTLGSWTP